MPDDQTIQAILDPDLTQQEYRPWIKENRAKFAERWRASGDMDRIEASRLIRRGALQSVASMLLDQLTQQRSGESEISQGMRLMEAAKGKSDPTIRKQPGRKPRNKLDL
jgi:hypothetical protein